jgi:hypothetical protein
MEGQSNQTTKKGNAPQTTKVFLDVKNTEAEMYKSMKIFKDKAEDIFQK